MKEAFKFQFIFRVMRISLCQFLLVGLWALGTAKATDGQAQALLSKKVTVDIQEQGIENVLGNLEKQVNGKFVYSAKMIGSDRKVSVKAAQKPLYKVLDETLKPLGLHYRVTDNLIIISRSDKSAGGPSMGIRSRAAGHTVSGKITDVSGETLSGVTVILSYNNLGVVTDINGTYSFTDIPDGSYTLNVTSIGFTAIKKEIQVAGQDVQLNIEMKDDILQLQEIVVTGGNPKKKIESSVAITTINNKDIQTRAPLNSTDLLKAIPGLTVESTGGDGPGNVWVRGFPQQGGYIFLGIMEDGLPVLPTGFNSIPSVDQYYKTDLTIKNIEAVRGGNASIVMTNTPGAVINNLSYTGADKTYGKFKATTGLSQGLYRLDGNVGGKVSDQIRYNIGGFFRIDKGIVPPGYTANQGGQLKGNMTFNFKNQKGFVRVYGKYLNDKVQWMLTSFYPYDGSGKPAKSGNFDMVTQSLATVDTKFSYTDASGVTHNYDFADGMHTKQGSGGFQFNYLLDNGWEVNNNFRYQHTNRTVTAGIPASIITYNGSTPYYYLDGSEAGLKAGDRIVNVTGIGQQGKDVQIVDYLDFKKSISNHNVGFGVGIHQFNRNDGPNYNFSYQQEFKENPKRLLTSPTGAKITATNLATVIGDTRTLSAYASDEITLNPQWRLDLGVRIDNQNVDGKRPFYAFKADGTPDYTKGAGLTIAGYTDYSETITNWAATAGLNYKINNEAALFARATRAYNAPTIADYNATAYDPAKIKKRPVYLGEVGVKYAKNDFSLFASASYSAIKNVSLSITVPTISSGNQVLVAFGSTRTYSAEFEASYKLTKALSLRWTGTLQDSKYTDYTANTNTNSAIVAILGDTTYSFTGKRTERVPVFNTELSATYDYKKFNIYLAGNYIGSRFTSPSDSYKLPAYVLMKGGAGYNFTKAINVRFWVDNLLNARVLTEGDVRGDQFRNFAAVEKGTMMPGRTILPRSFWLSLSYEF